MATSSDAAIPIRDPIAGLNSILDLYSGKQTVSDIGGATTTDTTKSNMTADQLQSQIDQAMAPLNAGAHAAGLSTYSDTSLALGRAQVAGDILAKNAGTTSTKTSSGSTNTVTTPGALSASRIGQTAGNLLLTQIGAPLAKKITAPITDLTNSLSNSMSSSLDNILNPVDQTVQGGENAVVRDAMSSAADNIGSSVVSDAGTTALTDTATSGGTDILSSIGDSLSQATSGVSGFLDNLFAIGGQVKKNSIGYADGGAVSTAAPNVSGGDDSGGDDGYADGGQVAYLDSPANTGSNLVAQSLSTPVLSAMNETVPTVGGSASDLLLNYIAGKTGSKSTVDGSDTSMGGSSSVGPQLGAVASGPTLGQAGLSNAGLTALGLMGPMGALASKIIGTATDTPSLTTMAINSATAIPGEADPGAAVGNDALTGFLSLNDNFGTSGKTNGGGDNTSGDRGPGGSSGEAGAAAGGAGPSGPGAANGGSISGPGTGTSDSIPARLSDGETVITAQTTAKVKQVLGDDFFHNLEQLFNAPAAAAQVAQGRT